MYKNKNFFEVFGIDISTNINLDKLEKSYFELQQKFHPDKFINKPHYEKVAALNISMLINEAYEILKDPIKRIEHILNLNNIKKNEHESFKSDINLLQEMLQDREELDEAFELSTLKEVQTRANEKEQNAIKIIEELFKENKFKEAGQIFIKLTYIKKLQEEIKLKIKSVIGK